MFDRTTLMPQGALLFQPFMAAAVLAVLAARGTQISPGDPFTEQLRPVDITLYGTHISARIGLQAIYTGKVLTRDESEVLHKIGHSETMTEFGQLQLRLPAAEIPGNSGVRIFTTSGVCMYRPIVYHGYSVASLRCVY